MTTTMFLTLLTVGSLVSSLLTEAIKKAFVNVSTNMIALANAVIVGLVGTSATYILMGVEWNPQNIVCLILMVICVWMGSMVGYDKVIQTVVQIKDLK